VYHSVKAIICHRGQYLLQKRDNKKNIYFPGLWGVFGGNRKKNEKITISLKRELKEELNLNCKIIKKIFSFKVKSKNFSPERTNHYFICKLPKNYKKKIVLREGKAYKFFNIKKINHLKIIPWDLAMLYYHHFAHVKKIRISPVRK